MTRYHYRHYGLTLEANEALPSGTPHEAQAADVTVEVLPPGASADFDLPWVMLDPTVAVWRAETDRGSYLRLRYLHHDEWTEFVVDEAGARVWMTRSPTVLLEEATDVLLGSVFSCLLAQRGLTCLHAAVIALDDEVIGLVGHSGAGKSTTALALVQHGARLISDDVAALTQVDGRVTVAAGAPRVKVNPDSASLLLGSYESLLPAWSERHEMAPKRYFPVPRGEERRRESGHAIDSLYVLGWSEGAAPPSIRPLPPARALATLMAHRHMAPALPPTAHSRDFKLLARLSESAAVSDLVRPVGLETTAQTVASIVSDARRRAAAR